MQKFLARACKINCSNICIEKTEVSFLCSFKFTTYIKIQQKNEGFAIGSDRIEGTILTNLQPTFKSTFYELSQN